VISDSVAKHCWLDSPHAALNYQIRLQFPCLTAKATLSINHNIAAKLYLSLLADEISVGLRIATEIKRT